MQYILYQVFENDDVFYESKIAQFDTFEQGVLYIIGHKPIDNHEWELKLGDVITAWTRSNGDTLKMRIKDRIEIWSKVDSTVN